MARKPPATKVNNARRRLFGLISKLPEDEILKLVQKLESKCNLKAKERRKHLRKPIKIEASIAAWDSTLSEPSIHKISFTDFIQNISKEGVFIETAYPFRTNQRLTLTFPLPGIKDPINVKGKIVGIDPHGVGVKFDEILTDL